MLKLRLHNKDNQLPKKIINQCFKTKEITRAEHEAIKTLSRGEATEHQQQLVLKVIVNKICRANDILYIPGTFDETAFLNGRAFVGQHILKLLTLPVAMPEVEVTNIKGKT